VVCDASTAPTLAEAAGERNLDLRLVNAEDMASAEWSPPATDLYPGTTANIQYTSGTTGFPKGCLLTHRYWVQMGIGASELIGITKEDRVVTAQPHSYIDPQWNVVVSLLMGCELLILDGFHPSTFMRDVAKHRITVFYCLGVMPTLLLKQPPSAHDRNHALRAVHCSAIPLDKHAEIETRFRAPWFEAFGMTETGINSGVLVKDHDELVGTGCIGNPTSYNEVAVLDGEGRELGPRMKGELVFRGKGFMNGYFRDPEATSTFFKDGWAHTGDLAELDEEGRIYFRGRLKEMIRRGGENIAPGEIEEAVSSHPSVLECAVRGVPDPDFEEEIKAYVVLNEGKSLSAEDLIAYLTGRLARFKVPRYIEFRKDLPHTPSERVAKHLLEKDAESWRLNTVDMRDQNTRSQRTTE
jgi:crotonobetaine/carnitine-CoA ligase